MSRCRVRASQLPDDQLDSDLFFASVGLAEIVHRRTNGQHPWGNVGVEYAGPPLAPRTRYVWRVQVWDDAGQSHESQTAWWETACTSRTATMSASVSACG